jgi:adenosylcobinamide kinase/adenosylcobinamide-phosphate guanylyltransferase
MLTLILGGARSGKSALAERLAAASGRPVLFIATLEPGDDEMRARIAAHRRARPATWRTVEEPLVALDAATAHARAGDFVLLDCVTLWVSNLILSRTGNHGDDADDETTAEAVASVRGFAEWASGFDGDVAAVSNEVGMGLVPPYPLGRAFRDALGAANREIAARADRVYYVVAGLALELRSLGAAPLDAFGAPDA